MIAPYTTSSHPLARRGPFDLPFQFILGAMTYRVVTNGPALLAECGTFDARESVGTMPHRFSRVMTPLIGRGHRVAVPTTLAELRAFAGPSRVVECSACPRDDMGKPMGCDECDGDGCEVPVAEVTLVHGVLIDRALLADALTGPDDCDVRIASVQTVRSRDDMPVLIVYGPTWFAAVMCMAARCRPEVVASWEPAAP